MASPTNSDTFYDCPQNPLHSPPPSPPLLALPLRGPIYEHLFSSTSDLGSDTASAYAHDAAIAGGESISDSTSNDGRPGTRRISNASLASRVSQQNVSTSRPTTPLEVRRPNGSASVNDVASSPTPSIPARLPPSSQSHRPYWQPHHRTASSASYRSLVARQEHDRDRFSRQPIMLEDHSEAHRPEDRTLWAKHVTIDSYIIVGNPNSFATSAFVLWNCTLQLESGPLRLTKRYSEFDSLRRNLIRTFPGYEAAVPPLPPKSVMSKFRQDFLEKRKEGLSYFLNCVLLHPEFAASALLQEWLFKRGKGVRDLRIPD